jgi:hypothetical protein
MIAVSRPSKHASSLCSDDQETASLKEDVAVTKGSSQSLTAEALAAQNTTSAAETWEEGEEKRIDRLRVADFSLGFDLPRQCFQNENWEMHAWLDSPPTARHLGAVQDHLRNDGTQIPDAKSHRGEKRMSF